MDYEKIGFKSGIEIHQQLYTNKLFCNCPSTIRDDKPDFTIKRLLRASAGETGEVDVAAKHEEMKKKYYLYEGYHDTTCLVELDEEPPHEINQEALRITLQVASMVKAKIVEKIQVMRKTVVDGSNTTGFQRTALIARDGYLETSKGKVRIPTICLEEDAAKIVKRKQEYDIYNLSRLGIPLIEIATAPDLKSGEHAKEAAEKIGMILRSTGKVKRGLGTIRQDVNVSIKGGERIEIKGAQDLKMIPKMIEYECQRQENLIKISKEPGKIKINENIHDLTKKLEKSSSKIIKNAIDSKGAILGIKLQGMKGYLGREVEPGRRLGTEYSDYGKMAGVKGLFHSDELPAYGITQKEVDIINNEMKCSGKDAFIIIADKEEKARIALGLVIKRAKKTGVLKEVRKANADGTTSFLRPMPGAARMYPETDVETIIPDTKHIIKIELIEDKIKRFEKEYKLSKELATGIVKARFDFAGYTRLYNNIKPSFIANIILNSPKEIKKRYNIEMQDLELHIDKLFELLNNNKITKEGVFETLVDIAKGNPPNYEKHKPVPTKEVEEEIKRIINEQKGISPKAMMGIVMSKYRGKIEGKKVMKLIEKLTKS